jgi:myo-inositol 2-dehydrogenase/D-chiro-inositol 1-dehydrogenase
MYATWTAGHGNFTLELYGSEASLVVDLVERQTTRLFRRNGAAGPGGFSFPDLVWEYGYAGEQQEFVDRVRGVADASRAADAADARSALALVLALQRSLDEQRIVELG